MKKSIAAISVLCCFPLFAYAMESSNLLTSPSFNAVIGTFFQWVLLFAIPLLIGATIFLSGKYFFKEGVKNKKGIPVSCFGIIIKIIVPYCIFAGMLVFSKHQIGGYTCDCFAGYYEKIIVDIIAILFFLISIGVAYFMKKDKKEWKALHTLLIIVSFFITFYLTMTIGEYFYA